MEPTRTAESSSVRRSKLVPIVQPILDFFSAETAGGIVLLVATVVALVWANSPWRESYQALWHHKLAIGPMALSIEHWVNDGLMVIFFLMVGLEIKRELLVGELASVQRAALPIAAAAGGMVVPAAIYAAINIGGPGVHGWGVPMATDIAFAAGVLTLAGKRVPFSLKVFLLAIAIVDDLGAVLVIAIFYTSQLSGGALAIAAALLLVLAAMNKLGIRRPWPYLIAGVALWLATLHSGLHATIAGVLLAFTIPAGGEPSTLARIEHALLKPVSFVIIPIFALANAGVPVIGGDVGAMAHSPVTWGVALGLLIGKPVGVLAASWLTVKAGWARLPAGAGVWQIVGVAMLCGIGFTMSLFVTQLAFPGHAELADASKLGVMTGSLIAGVAGAAIILVASKQGEQP